MIKYLVFTLYCIFVLHSTLAFLEQALQQQFMQNSNAWMETAFLPFFLKIYTGTGLSKKISWLYLGL